MSNYQRCPDCNKPIAPLDDYCRFCGHTPTPASRYHDHEPTRQPARRYTLRQVFFSTLILAGLAYFILASLVAGNPTTHAALLLFGLPVIIATTIIYWLYRQRQQ